MLKEKIRISLKSFNANSIEESCELVFQNTKKFDEKLKVKGPIFLPTRKKIYCVLRSPHVNKDAREQFEIRSYKRIIDIYSDSKKNLEAFSNLNFPSGTLVKMKYSKI
jgi:small subunit ribosomal protein S10